MTSEPLDREAVPRRVPPRTRRGERTRAALIAGVREVFERDVYLDARTADIFKAAGAAAGSWSMPCRSGPNSSRPRPSGSRR
ncbi:hypothetical protein [Nocardia sp. NPDC046763]|uniref:hypothetical protein n=1 Tax=Nocardia sp. NPDC046763 TaxID=3155256 RepID=UPI0034098340